MPPPPPRQALRRAAAFAAAVCAFTAVADWPLLNALYARGQFQTVLAPVLGLSALVQVPGLFLAHAVGARAGHHTEPGEWLLIFVLNFFVYLLAARGAVAAGTRLGRRRANPGAAADVAATAEPRVSRRRLIVGGAGALAAGVVGHSLLVEPRRIEVTRRVFPLTGLPPALDGLRLVQLTDLHHGPWVPLSYVRYAVELTNGLAPDVVLLTGDYVHRSPAYIAPVARALAALRPKIATLAVLGNHDWWEDGGLTVREFARHGIPLIDNARRFIGPSRALADHADEGLCVAGVGDYYEDEQRYDAALGGVPERVPRLLLSHNPDVAEDAAFRASPHRVDLMISGHTHGGQIYVPGLGTPIVPSRYGQKYARGLVRGPKCPVFVCRGVGLTVLPVRVGVRPEVAVLELRRA